MYRNLKIIVKITLIREFHTIYKYISYIYVAYNVTQANLYAHNIKDNSDCI